MKVPFKRWEFEPNKTKDIKAYKNNKVVRRNYTLYVKWAISLLKQAAGELEVGEQYDTTALSLHPDHNDYLRGYLYAFDWLNHSPCDNEEIPLDEVWIDVEKAKRKVDTYAR